MTDDVRYELADGIATITMDDGGANLMTEEMIAALSGAFEQAEADQAVTILTGSRTMFSAGYDMAEFQRPMEEVARTVRRGGELVHQVLAHPLPVVAACNGHAVAQGAFTLLACDIRVGSAIPLKIGLNEVAIGLTIPHYGIEVARHVLSPAWFDRATVTGELYDGETALDAGFLHELVDPPDLLGAVGELAARLGGIDMAAHAGTKARVRRHVLEAIRTGLDTEFDQALAAAVSEPAREDPR